MANFEAAQFALSIVGLMGNFFAGYIIIRKRLYSEIRFVILQNLIIEDTLFLLIKIIESSVLFSGVKWAEDLTENTLNITLALLCLSMLLSASLMIDRMLAIFYCLRYNAIITRFKVRIVMAILWMFTTAYAATSLSLGNYKDIKDTLQNIIMFVVIVPTWLFMLFANISIEKIRRHHINKINATKKQVMQNQKQADGIGDLPKSNKGKLDFLQSTAAVARQIKIINWVTLLLMTPSCIQAITDVIGKDIIPTEVISSFTLIYIATNSYVYILAMPELKAYVLSLACQKQHEDTSQSNQSTNISMV